MICDSKAVLNSSATDTQINIPVAVNTAAEPWSMSLNTIEGINATNARKIAPNNVILLDTRFKCSVVGLPGLIPGIKPQFCWIFLEISSGLNWMVV